MQSRVTLIANNIANDIGETLSTPGFLLQASGQSLVRHNGMINHVGAISLRRWSFPTLRTLSRLADGSTENVHFSMQTSANWMRIFTHQSISGVMKRDLDIC